MLTAADPIDPAAPAGSAAPARQPLMYGLVSGAVIVAALYFGRDMLMPLALAALLGFVLDPMVSWLKRRGLPRAVAVVVVVTTAVALLAGAGWFMYGQLRQLASDLPAYETNINQKVRSLGKTLRQPGMFDRYSRVVDRFEREIDPAQRQGTPAPRATARPRRPRAAPPWRSAAAPRRSRRRPSPPGLRWGRGPGSRTAPPGGR